MRFFFFFPSPLCIWNWLLCHFKELVLKGTMTQEGGMGEWQPQIETNWSPGASCLTSLNGTHSAWFLWLRWTNQL